MLKNISSLGKALSNAKQKEVFGGRLSSVETACYDECSDYGCDDPNKTCEKTTLCDGILWGRCVCTNGGD